MDSLSINEINVGEALARIEGEIKLVGSNLKSDIRLVIEQMKSGDERQQDLTNLLKQQITFHAAELGKLEAIVRENRTIAATELSAVRVDLEKQITQVRVETLKAVAAVAASVETVTGHVTSLRLSKAYALGFAGAGGVVGAGLMALIPKVLP